MVSLQSNEIMFFIWVCLCVCICVCTYLHTHTTVYREVREQFMGITLGSTSRYLMSDLEAHILLFC